MSSIRDNLNYKEKALHSTGFEVEFFWFRRKNTSCNIMKPYIRKKLEMVLRYRVPV